MAEIVIIEPMDALQARDYVQRINNRAAEMSRLLLELKDRQGWKALGYTSWHECVKNEFAYSSQHLYRLLDTAQVNQTIAGILPGVNLPERHAREVKTFPQELQPAIVQIAQATAKAQGRDATSGDYKRVGMVIQEAAITGAVDTGNGESTPFTAALSVEQYEAMQRQQQQILDKLNAGKSAPVIRLTLPYPVSANRYWRVYNNIVVVSQEAKDYKAQVAVIAHQMGIGQPLTEEVKIALDVYRPRKQGDLDNSLKVTIDALKGLAYVDDNQIIDIHARRFDDALHPRVDVRISAVELKTPVAAGV